MYAYLYFIFGWTMLLAFGSQILCKNSTELKLGLSHLLKNSPACFAPSNNQQTSYNQFLSDSLHHNKKTIVARLNQFESVNIIYACCQRSMYVQSTLKNIWVNIKKIKIYIKIYRTEKRKGKTGITLSFFDRNLNSFIICL